MMMTSYLITQKPDGYLLQCTGGPCKVGLERIETDESSLVQDLITLRVPEGQRATALQELRSHQSTIVTFDAKTMDPL